MDETDKKINKSQNLKREIELQCEMAKIQAERIVRLASKIKKAHGYKNNHGREVLEYHLIQKHNWLPSQVKSMNEEDLLFALSEHE